MATDANNKTTRINNVHTMFLSNSACVAAVFTLEGSNLSSNFLGGFKTGLTGQSCPFLLRAPHYVVDQRVDERNQKMSSTVLHAQPSHGKTYPIAFLRNPFFMSITRFLAGSLFLGSCLFSLVSQGQLGSSNKANHITALEFGFLPMIFLSSVMHPRIKSSFARNGNGFNNGSFRQGSGVKTAGFCF